MAWESKDNIFLYDGISTTQLPGNSYVYGDTIQVSGSNVVWQGITNNQLEIFLATSDIPPVLISGDANHDGTVDEDDAAILATYWQTASSATWEMGNFNGDYAVNDLDATMMAANWGFGTSAVPEPSTLTLLLLCGASLFARARRSKR